MSDPKDVEIQALRAALEKERAEHAVTKTLLNTAKDVLSLYCIDLNGMSRNLDEIDARGNKQRLEINFLHAQVIKKDNKIACLEAELDTKDAEIAQLSGPGHA